MIGYVILNPGIVCLVNIFLAVSSSLCDTVRNHGSSAQMELEMSAKRTTLNV